MKALSAFIVTGAVLLFLYMLVSERVLPGIFRGGDVKGLAALFGVIIAMLGVVKLFLTYIRKS